MGAIINFFKTIIDFILTFIEGVVWLITNLPTWTQIVLGTVTYAPAFLAVFLTLSLSVTVLFAVLKRL